MEVLYKLIFVIVMLLIVHFVSILLSCEPLQLHIAIIYAFLYDTIKSNKEVK